MQVPIGILTPSCHDTAMNKTKIVLDLPDQLISKLDEEVKTNGYDSREEAAIFIIRYYFDNVNKISASTV